MLRITIELVPHGNEALKKTVGVAHVSNIGGASIDGEPVDVCHYNVVEMTEDDIHQIRIMHVPRFANIFRFLEALFQKRTASGVIT